MPNLTDLPFELRAEIFKASITAALAPKAPTRDTGSRRCPPENKHDLSGCGSHRW